MTSDDRRIRLAADGVIASYIHEISPRRRVDEPPRGGDDARDA